MQIKIYQIDMERDKNRVAFINFNSLSKFQDTDQINSSIYDCVFSGVVECKSLEEVYQMFNVNPPEEYKGRSLLVSDIVEVLESDVIDEGFYYCDNIGFEKVDFDPKSAVDRTRFLKYRVDLECNSSLACYTFDYDTKEAALQKLTAERQKGNKAYLYMKLEGDETND